MVWPELIVLVSKRKKLAFVAASMVLAVGLALLTGEAAVRVLAKTYSIEDLQNSSLTYRPAVFTRHRLVPDRTLLQVNRDPAEAIRINQHGFRGEEFALAKSPGTVRILFLGGSSLFSMRCRGPGKDWPHRTIDYLRKQGIEAECINAGVPGHDTADSVGKFLTELWMYQPDYVLLYQGYNDQKYFGQLDDDRPYRGLHEPYEPELDPRTHVVGLDRALCRSKLYLELRYRYLGRKYGSEGLRPAVDPADMFDEFSPVALQQYRLNVQTICDLARNVGAVPVLCTQGRLVHPDNTPGEIERLRFNFVKLTHEAWCRAFADCDRTIEEVAAHKSTPLIDVSAVVTGDPTYFHDHVHLTEAGAQVVSEVVGRGLYEIMHKRAAGLDPSQATPSLVAR